MSAKHHKIVNKNKFITSCCILLIIIIILITFSVFLFQKIHSSISTSASTQLGNTSSDNNISNAELKDTTIKLSVIGDIMCHNTQYRDAYQSSNNTYDFSYVFSEIKEYFEDANLAIGNLETTFAGNGRDYTSYPTFNSPEALAKNLKDMGLDIVSTANNHCMDTGYKGLVNTLNVLDENNIEHMGTYRTQQEQEQILIKDIQGIKIAFLSYTYGTNGIPIPSDKSFSVNLIDKDLIAKQIQQAKDAQVDIICASMHWGIEYRDTPNEEQQDLANFLFKNGVDIIFGSHPHVLEKMEKVNVTTTDGKNKTCFIIYSFGNFVSGQVKDKTRSSIILNLTITKKADSSISFDHIDYIPIYCYTSSKSKGFKLINIPKELKNYANGNSSYINSSNYSFFQSELERIQNVLQWNYTS